MFSRLRLHVTFFLIIGFFAGLVGKLYLLQVCQHESLSKLARRQHNVKVVLPARRGDIYDRSFSPLATSIPGFSIYARPQIIACPKDVARKLAPILNKSTSWVYERLTSSSPFVWLKRQADEETAQAIDALGIKGVGWVKESRRFYPEGELASHVLGFAGVDGQGLEGVELYYDKYLRGTPGWFVAERDGRRRPILTLSKEYMPPVDGLGLVLTIDKGVQFIVEQELERAWRESGAKQAVAIVADVKTGEILALACRPTYDPNKFKEYNPSSWRNRAVSDIYEPGSTFKIIVASGAMEEGVVGLEERIFCENGTFPFAGHIIHDHTPHAWLTFREAIKYSSNIALGKVGLRLGAQELYKFIRAFGFGEKTGIDLPGEVPGIVRPYTSWSKLDPIVISFGQGIGVTPIQMVQAFATIANRGVMVKLHVGKAVVDENGKIVREFSPTIKGRVLDEDVADKIIEAMVGVVEGGTGKRALINGITVAGKTGTAQKLEPDGTYSHTKFVASFVGFMPAEDPEYLIFVMLDEPQGSYYGGTVAAPVFSRIGEKMLAYMRYPHIEREGAVRAQGEGVKQDRQDEILPVERVELGDFEYLISSHASNDAIMRMPDLAGKTAREVLNLFSGMDVELSIKGVGVVKRQEPSPGELLKAGDRVKIYLASAEGEGR